MRKIRIFALALAMICAGTVPVFAYMFIFESEPTYIASGVTLQSYPTPNMTLGFYWDENCTQPVTSFDFGEMIHPPGIAYLWAPEIYIKNEGDAWHDIRWNSTIDAPGIGDCWAYQKSWGLYPIVNRRLEPGEVLTTYYGIRIPAYATVGSYNWTLTAWGEHTY